MDNVNTHGAPINRIQAQAGVRVAVWLGTVHWNVVVHEDVFPALRISEDSLATGSVDVVMGCKHEGSAGVP